MVEEESTRRIAYTLAGLSIACAFSLGLLMATALLMLFSAVALVLSFFSLYRNSREAAIAADIVFLALILASHETGAPRSVSSAPLDVLRLILLIAFHEFSSIFYDLHQFSVVKTGLTPDITPPTFFSGDRSAFVRRTASTAGILLFSAVISEVYILVAGKVSASLNSIYGVGAGLMIIIASLFLLLTYDSNRSGDR